jgi:hypothetical protein
MTRLVARSARVKCSQPDGRAEETDTIDTARAVCASQMACTTI